MGFAILVPQSNFNVEEYYQFLEANQDLTSSQLISRFEPKTTYFSRTTSPLTFDQYTFLDSVQHYYQLTPDEWDLLQKQRFVVTERLNFSSFGHAFHDIYKNDLPVFISTDAILQALHRSYDQILMDLEIEILEPKLTEILDRLYAAYSQLLDRYGDNQEMLPALGDVDLYISMAKSLLQEAPVPPQFIPAEELQPYWDAVQAEDFATMPLFSDNCRYLDFSQFTVRGHYTQQYWDGGSNKTLGAYFQSMMWLGRMDFLLTLPPSEGSCQLSDSDIQRMNLGAVLMNELLDLANSKELLTEIDAIITFMVGESDNLTPTELAGIVNDQNLSGTHELLNDSNYIAFQQALISSREAPQHILSSIFIMDPLSTEPDPLPISYRLLGQRFIIDSYIFSNVVYDRIIYNGQKIWRPLPDPMDAMFVLGNDDALPLLVDELDRYYYASALAGLRYLVDSYDDDFWDQSLYNAWLQGLRRLNPPADDTQLPFFMKTVAWHQQKLNTQLASWAQLRHDNLLYAKQSYTGGTVCSYPHSFIEPYPEFYIQIRHFAMKANAYFSGLDLGNSYRLRNLGDYFMGLEAVMDTLTMLAEKEIRNEPFSDAETEFLKQMLFVGGGSGAPPFSGWYAELFYTMDDAAKEDYVIADVHTQPTDQGGNFVGNILHVGVGEVNLGVFLAPAPSASFEPMAYVGPVMSYYQKINPNFDRLTDERWADLVRASTVPVRPDWVNVYLADSSGLQLGEGRQLAGGVYTAVDGQYSGIPDRFVLHPAHPNPFNPVTILRYDLPQPAYVNLRVYDIRGREVKTLVNKFHEAGYHSVIWDATGNLHTPVSAGVYLYHIQAGNYSRSGKLLLMK